MASGGRTALRISGRVGKFDFINECYEPMTEQHNGKNVWCARAVAPRYLFFSGKSRWVINKWLNEGENCFAYCTGDSPDGNTWTCLDESGNWTEDPNIKCEKTQPNDDMFVKIRMQLDGEMKALGLTTAAELKPLWKKLDYNGNGVVSLAEIDKMVVEMIKAGLWPEWLNNKPALMRAYKKTIHIDGDGDAWVQKKEFHALLLNVFWFNKLFKIFHSIASVEERTDRRIDFNNFHEGMSKLGLGSLDKAEALKEFQCMDMNGEGQVLFVEFCAYVRRRVNPDVNPYFDADIVSGTDCSVHMRKGVGNKGTNAYKFTRKTLACFDNLEKKILTLTRMRPKMKKLWNRIDYNGDGFVTVAEISKMCANEWPLMNHEPALQAAYNKAVEKTAGDGKIEQSEFKVLLCHMLYYNKIMWLMNQIDNDRDSKIGPREFKQLLLMSGNSIESSEADRMFRELDSNGNGFLDFDEFVMFFTSKMAPDATSKLVGHSKKMKQFA
jgi:Ca2+-binding EF-hand superfamily protein